MPCDCAEKLVAYATELREWGMAQQGKDARGAHAIHDAEHYYHASLILKGHKPTIDDAANVPVGSPNPADPVGTPPVQVRYRVTT